MTSGKHVQAQDGDALIIVDVQSDFLPGGALAVPQGDEVVPVLNRYIAAFAARGLPVYATRDWHPAGHCSFRPQGGIWPPHCIAESEGARFATNLAIPGDAVIISKATTADKDAYSGFEGTGLGERLREAGVRRVFIGGLATDYCVLQTVKDALTQGFDVILLQDAIRAVNLKPDDGAQAEREMQRLGAEPVSYDRVANA